MGYLSHVSHSGSYYKCSGIHTCVGVPPVGVGNDMCGILHSVSCTIGGGEGYYAHLHSWWRSVSVVLDVLCASVRLDP